MAHVSNITCKFRSFLVVEEGICDIHPVPVLPVICQNISPTAIQQTQTPFCDNISKVKYVQVLY